MRSLPQCKSSEKTDGNTIKSSVSATDHALLRMMTVRGSTVKAWSYD